MELLFLSMMALGAYWVARRVGFSISDQTIAVLVRGFRANAATALPSRPTSVAGDQEATSGPAAPLDADPAPKPTLTSVKPVVHAR